jgi:hypothetical protein
VYIESNDLAITSKLEFFSFKISVNLYSTPLIKEFLFKSKTHINLRLSSSFCVIDNVDNKILFAISFFF